jgi:hypothetical protein
MIVTCALGLTVARTIAAHSEDETKRNNNFDCEHAEATKVRLEAPWWTSWIWGQRPSTQHTLMRRTCLIW